MVRIRCEETLRFACTYGKDEKQMWRLEHVNMCTHSGQHSDSASGRSPDRALLFISKHILTRYFKTGHGHFVLHTSGFTNRNHFRNRYRPITASIYESKRIVKIRSKHETPRIFLVRFTVYSLPLGNPWIHYRGHTITDTAEYNSYLHTLRFPDTIYFHPPACDYIIKCSLPSGLLGKIFV